MPSNAARIIVFSFIIFSTCIGAAQSVASFYEIQKKISAVHNNIDSTVNAKLGPMTEEMQKDPVKRGKHMEMWRAENAKYIKKRSVILHTNDVVEYPAFTFIDIEGNTYNLSDFSDQKVMLNFNYSFCSTCMNFIDTLASMIGKDMKLIVLLTDNPEYSQEVIDLYGQKALIGFISPQYKSYYSLYCGSPSVFLLSKGRYVHYIYDPTNEGYDAALFKKQINSWP